MALMTPQEYIESLRKLNTRVYMFGEKSGHGLSHRHIFPVSGLTCPIRNGSGATISFNPKIFRRIRKYGTDDTSGVY